MEQERQAERSAMELIENEEAEKQAQASKKEKAKKKKAREKERKEKKKDDKPGGSPGEKADDSDEDGSDDNGKKDKGGEKRVEQHVKLASNKKVSHFFFFFQSLFHFSAFKHIMSVLHHDRSCNFLFFSFFLTLDVLAAGCALHYRSPGAADEFAGCGCGAHGAERQGRQDRFA
jgi:hypothetical protein